MIFPTIIAGLLVGLSQFPGGLAQPTSPANATGFIITHAASDYFPHAKGDLTPYDVDVHYVGYDADTQSWLTALNPASGASDRHKAIMMTEAAYAKPFDETDPDMTDDVNSLLAAVAGNTTTSSLERRAAGSSFKVATAHAVKWTSCAGVLSCLSGTTCSFSLNVGKAPRSQCQSQGGSNCCISWSNYNIRAGFFSTTWTTCNSEVTAEKRSTASCEGYGSGSQGGDVCLSNRANGCT